MPNGKTHKSLRIDDDVAERITSLREDGESEAATYNRVLRVGLDALEKPQENDEEPHSDPQAASQGVSGSHTEDDPHGLNNVVLEALTAQLKVKDEQIENLTELLKQEQIATQQAQQLHALTEARTQPQEAEAQEVTEETTERRGWWSRHFGRR